ncbi:hypothetical protein BO78DRAFT_210705 [Aspergillus sclerotiicarbonarius CBS 121057]|uniref:Protein kinase domain-containing protein n=1 Tax=Aspergillus sclerotiicarbonarius (strain CBS 121057 / IBT 28362) TaxID=1448318 RepID=A0A319FAB9_ASPSB|nr:hypothetical protein BO78DRAFT_210705 [Aspergillus sclerotiicarbonarius CBS 121057]
MSENADPPIIPYALIQSSGTLDDGDKEVVLRARQTLFRVLLNSQPPVEYDQVNTIEGQFLPRLADLDDEDALDELGDLLGPLCQPFFRTHARIYGNDLESHLRNPEITMQLVTKDGQPRVLELGRKEPSDNSPKPVIDALNKYPKFELSMAQVVNVFMTRHVYEVDVNGTIFICKTGGVDYSSFAREVEILDKITSLQLSLRTPKVEGAVGLGTECPGVLLTKICHESCLSQINIEETDVAERRKWYTQTKDLVDCLHQNDIIWGDVKAGNILIDNKRESWVVDFGGGYTEGWVSQRLQETVEGDLEGLQNLYRYLRL